MRQLAMALIGAGGIVLLAGAMRNHGWSLADQICARGAILCDNPVWVLVAIGILVFMATIQTIIKT